MDSFKFLKTSNKKRVSFFTILKTKRTLRGFSYSGILDIQLKDSILVIHHVSTKIFIKGSGLFVIYHALVDLEAELIFVGLSDTDSEGNLYKITEVIYDDEQPS